MEQSSEEELELPHVEEEPSEDKKDAESIVSSSVHDFDQILSRQTRVTEKEGSEGENGSTEDLHKILTRQVESSLNFNLFGPEKQIKPKESAHDIYKIFSQNIDTLGKSAFEDEAENEAGSHNVNQMTHDFIGEEIELPPPPQQYSIVPAPVPQVFHPEIGYEYVDPTGEILSIQYSESELSQDSDPDMVLFEGEDGQITPEFDKLLKLDIGPDEKLKYIDADGKVLPAPNIDPIIAAIEPRMHQCPSIESFLRKPDTLIDCNFYYAADGKIYTKDCRLDVTVWALKKEISKFVRVPPDNLDFRRNRNLVADKKTLLELGGKAKRKMKFTVEINKRVPGNYELFNPRKNVPKARPDVFRNVKVENESGGYYKVPIQISYEINQMRYMGGYFDKRRKVKYLHATVQTKLEEPHINELAKNTACQTFADQSVSQQTPCDKAQQMERDDFYISTTNDKVLHAKKYYSFDWWEKQRGESAIIIQRYWRRWLAIKERKRRMDGLIARIEWAESVRKGRTDQRLAIMDDEMKRQQNPVRLLDMELLYRAINAWRKDEEAFVKENRWGAERRAALATLTEMEADLLLDLEKTKNKIKVTHRDDYINSIFTKMGKPKRWLGAKTNNFINMDSADKLRVRQLHSLYKELQLPSESKEQRLELLDRLINMIKHYSSNMSKYLMSLINREIAMMNRHVSKRLLSGVRSRIANGLYHLCQDPNYNPEAKMLQKVPWDEQKLRKDMVQCKGCRRMQYRDEFTILRGTTVTTRCHNCMNLYRTSILRVDLNLYRHMLKELRRDELASGVTNSVSLLIDAFDIQFLVEQIWHGQSALSGIDNRYLLRLCRWNRDLPWMPWNCVLLTEEEAVAHLQLDDMHDAYRETFFHKVNITQSAARTYYERLSKLSLNLDDKVKDTCEDINNRNIWRNKRKAQLRTKMKTAFAPKTAGSGSH